MKKDFMFYSKTIANFHTLDPGMVQYAVVRPSVEKASHIDCHPQECQTDCCRCTSFIWSLFSPVLFPCSLHFARKKETRYGILLVSTTCFWFTVLFFFQQKQVLRYLPLPVHEWPIAPRPHVQLVEVRSKFASKSREREISFLSLHLWQIPEMQIFKLCCCLNFFFSCSLLLDTSLWKGRNASSHSGCTARECQSKLVFFVFSVHHILLVMFSCNDIQR